ncbi:MAG TPA: AAA family ATPase, partial [Actinomycetes bacterium]|nr:AAA family ATPase [Actinomycetes bacterium]
MELVERDSELAALTAAWTRARKGDGGFVVVTGESGGGKTAVVEQFAQGLAGQVPVLWGACDPLTTPRPMGPLLDVRNDLGEAARSTLEGSGQGHDIYTAVYDRLLEAPCVLVVEDLHWSDQGTIELLRFLLRRIGQTRSLVVGTIRTDDVPLADPRRAFMGDVARSPSAVTVELAPLSKEALREMLGDRASEADQLYALTGGNPFFVTEMLTHQGPTIPVSVRDAILARTVDLGNSARDLLELLVCAAEAIPDRLLPDLGIDVDALRALSQAGLIQRSPTGVAFRHDICRQAIASTIPPGGEAALHQRLLTALESAGSVEPAVLVQHAVAVGDSERVLTYATSAAREASRTGAHSQSAEFYALALRVGRPRDEGQRAELLACLAMEEYLIDRLDEAIAACAEAVDLRTKQADLVNLSRDHQALSIYKWYDADRAAADWHADMAVSVLADTHEPATVGLAFALQAYLAVQRSDLPGALALLEQASRCANESSDP